MIEEKGNPRTIVAVGGFSSNAGKTSLICELLRAFPGWEAVKLTRGHYRSCGKDPHACCVSHLLGEEPSVRSGREATYAPGKDTGRFWDAGASNVHWVIATDAQVERGIRQALERVKTPGVFVEGNSFLRYVEPDVCFMAARAGGGQIKPSAKRALPKTTALYLFDEMDATEKSSAYGSARERFAAWVEASGQGELLHALPVYTREDLQRLASLVSEAHGRSAADALAGVR
ncbi:MAG TPA: hypothetical protein VGB73_11410 [Pyrinomonadaceae bacterium]|jgi:molybdopterin-guanine dinucleotide biosynthesis protein